MLHDIVKKGSTNRSVTIKIIDSTDGTPETGVEHNTAGIDLWYRREGAAKTSITEAALASLTTAHTDGGIEHIGDGVYRLDLADAAFATGAEYVDFGGTVTGMIVIGGRVRLVDVDIEDSVRAGLTALPNAAADAAGGLPISDAGGLDMDAIKTDTAAILVDTGTTLDGKIDTIDTNVDAILADTGTDGVVLAGTPNVNATQISGSSAAADALENIFGNLDTQINVASATTTTIVFDDAALSSVDDFYNGMSVFVYGGTGAGQQRRIDDYVGSTKTATVSPAWGTTPDATSDIIIVVGPGDLAGTAPSAAAVADAVWDEATSGHTGAGTFGEQLKTDVDAILADTNELQTDDVPGLIAALNDPTAAAVADAVLDELLSGHTTAGSLGKAIADIETDASAILADTGTDGVVLTAAERTAVANAVWGVTSAAVGAAVALGTSDMQAIIEHLAATAGHLQKQTQTASTYTLRNAGDTANIGTSTVSDDGTTFTFGSFS